MASCPRNHLYRTHEQIRTGAGNSRRPDRPGRLRDLDARRVRLEEQIATAAKPAPRLHPNLAQLYRQQVAQLTDLLARDDASEARELIRGLVEAIVLVPEAGWLRVEIRGELASILALAEGTRHDTCAGRTGGLSAQIKMVAGRRCHLYRTRIRFPVRRRKRTGNRPRRNQHPAALPASGARPAG